MLVFRTSIDRCFAGPTLFLLVSGTGPPGYFEDWFIFDRCRCSSAAGTPVKYECDSRNPTCTFSRSKIFLTEKLTNRALVSPTPGPKSPVSSNQSNIERVNERVGLVISIHIPQIYEMCAGHWSFISKNCSKLPHLCTAGLSRTEICNVWWHWCLLNCSHSRLVLSYQQQFPQDLTWNNGQSSVTDNK